MRNTGPILTMIVLVVLALFFEIDTTEAMARGGGAGGGGGFSGARGGGVRSGPPGAYRMRRVYTPRAPAREGGLTPRPKSEPQRPATRNSRPAGMQSPQTRGHSFVSPQESPANYRNITEKYEKLRENRHKDYGDQQHPGN